MDLQGILENDFYILALQFALGATAGFVLIKYFKKRAKQQRAQAILRAWDDYDPAMGNTPINTQNQSARLYRYDGPTRNSNGQMSNDLEDLENL